MQPDPIEQVEKWSDRGKPYWVQISRDDGYGASA